jgi:hypothetical protein
MGLLGCPDSFQRLMEGYSRTLLEYIGDLLVHTDTHEKHLQVLDQFLTRLHKNHLKINLEIGVFCKGSPILGIYSYAGRDQE